MKIKVKPVRDIIKLNKNETSISAFENGLFPIYYIGNMFSMTVKS